MWLLIGAIYALLFAIMKVIERVPAYISVHFGAACKSMQAWAQHFVVGRKVLVIGGPSGTPVELAKFAASKGAQVTMIDVSGNLGKAPKVSCGALKYIHEDFLSHSGKYDVLVMDFYISGLSPSDAKAALAKSCDLTPPSTGIILLRDFSQVRPNLIAGWFPMLLVDLPQAIWRGLTGDPVKEEAPYDAQDWLPHTAYVATRIHAGPLHDGITVRRRAQPPQAAVERLRRAYGDTSMEFCTSPCAHRLGTPENGIRFFLATKDGSVADKGNEIGYFAYIEKVILGGRLRLILMDPVCAHSDQAAVLGPFIEECRAVKARPIFACVSSDWIDTLNAANLHTTMLGGEVGIDLRNFTLPKERRRYLRAAPAKGLECHTECYDLEELNALNSAWVNSKASGTEILIWTWPPAWPKADVNSASQKKERDECKRMYTYQDGRLVGFVIAEPYYKGDGSGTLLGYGLNTIRFLPNLRPPWVSDFTVASLIESLQADGVTFLAFGLSPFSCVKPHPRDLPWLRSLNQLAWKANVESIYSVQGLWRKKEHHCANQGVKLQDRYLSADFGMISFADATRFMYLLFGDNLGKLPEAFPALFEALKQEFRAPPPKRTRASSGQRKKTARLLREKSRKEAEAAETLHREDSAQQRQ